MIRSFTEPSIAVPQFTIEEVIDPAEAARSRSQLEHFRRNSDWLQAHWSHLLPAARGKFLAVAGAEGFLGDTSEEAWAKAKAAHPEDDGAFSQYVPSRPGPRIYDTW